MDGHTTYMLRHEKNDDFPKDFAIFTKALWTDPPTDQRIADGMTFPLTKMR